jgi:3-hydroxy-3-methylglutaryl CoA synthase
MKRYAQVIGVGSYLPERVMTNKEFESIVETSDEWITTRTGIRERRIVAEGESTSDLGVRAVSIAMERAGVSNKDIDMLIVGEYVGTAGLSAVSQSSQIMNFGTMVCLGFSNAGQVLIS